MSEYQVLGLLQEMTMATNAYKTQTSSMDKAIVELLIASFLGQLKGWRHYHLIPDQQKQILNAIQTFKDGTPFLDDLGNPVQDAMSTLILTIF